MNKTLFLSIVVFCALSFSSAALAQNIFYDLTASVVDSAQGLEVKNPTLLPDNPFYFLKEWGRGIQSMLTFNDVKKAELKQKFSDERLIELQKLIEKGASQKAIEKATDKYTSESDKTKNAVDKIKDTVENNSAVDKFLDKFTKQQLLQEEILQKLEDQVPTEVFQKIKEARENHIEKFGEVMQKLENSDAEKIKERIQNKIQESSNNEFQGIKAIEVLNGLLEKLPEALKEKVQEIQQTTTQNVQQKIEALPVEKQEALKQYIENVSGDKIKMLQVLESLKVEVKDNATVKDNVTEYSNNIVDKIQEKNKERNCPTIVSPTPDFCPNGKITPQKNDSGCVISFECLTAGEEDANTQCPPICLNVGTDSEGWYSSCDNTLMKYDECKNCKAVCKNIGTKSEGLYSSCTEELIKWKVCSEKPAVCNQAYSPVCGKNGKTYTNECYAKNADTEVAYNGACKPECQKDSDCKQTSASANTRVRCVNNKCKTVSVAPNTENETQNNNNNSNTNSSDDGWEPKEGSNTPEIPFTDTGAQE